MDNCGGGFRFEKELAIGSKAAKQDEAEVKLACKISYKECCKKSKRSEFQIANGLKTGLLPFSKIIFWP